MNKYAFKKLLNIKRIINVSISIIVVYGLLKSVKTIDTEYIPETMLLSIIIFICIYQLSILLHEAGHALGLRLLKINVKVFKSGFIKYINNGEAHKIVFCKQGLLLGGGYVIPEINNAIYDEESFSGFARKYIYFIYSGIIITVILIVMASIFIILNKANFISFIILITNWLVILKSFDNKNLNFGDFYTISMLKNRPEYICAILQNNLMLEFPLNSFLVNKIENFLKDSINKQEYSELILGVADKILDEYIIRESELSNELRTLKTWVFKKYTSINNDDLIVTISIIKLSHKFLLHEYSLKMKSEFTYDYNRLQDYLFKNEHLTRYEIIKRIINTLNFLSKNENLLKSDFKYIISDLEFIAGECDNYNKKILLIINKLSI